MCAFTASRLLWKTCVMALMVLLVLLVDNTGWVTKGKGRFQWNGRICNALELCLWQTRCVRVCVRVCVCVCVCVYPPPRSVHTEQRDVMVSVHHGKRSWLKLQLSATIRQSLLYLATLRSAGGAFLQTETWVRDGANDEEMRSTTDFITAVVSFVLGSENITWWYHSDVIRVI